MWGRPRPLAFPGPSSPARLLGGDSGPPPALFWPHFGLGAVEPPAGWLPRLFQSENALALTPTPGFPPGTEHSVLCLVQLGRREEAPGGGKGRPSPGGWLGTESDTTK